MHAAEQVKVQTVPGYANGITDGMPKMINEGGIGSLYKGLVPLWARQIPYTMMKFGAQRNTIIGGLCLNTGQSSRKLALVSARAHTCVNRLCVPGLGSWLLREGADCTHKPT